MKHLLNNHKLSLKHPQHAILGLAVILVSTVLIFNDYYYFFPPFLAGFLNDDAIGVLGWILGTNLIVWAIRNKNSVRSNFWLLIFTCGFFAFESSAEVIHGIHAGRPHMLTAGAVEAILFLITLSIIGKSKKTNHKDER